MRSMKNAIIIFIMLAMISSLLATIFISANTEGKNVMGEYGKTVIINGIKYTTHSVIRINSDAEFAQMAAQEGWPGDGSAGNPYIIEKLSYESIKEENGLCIIWKDDFETDKGWKIEDATNPGEWERAIPQGLGSGSGGNPDPTQAHSGSYVLGNDLTSDGNYSNNLAKTYNITSPAINCSGYTNVVLVFWAWLNVEREMRMIMRTFM